MLLSLHSQVPKRLMRTIRWFGGLACLAQFARAPRLVYAATHARSVLESGGALPLSLPRLFLGWLCFSHWVCWKHRRVLHRVYWVYAYYAFRHLGSLLASGCALACLRPAYAAAAVATIAIILLVSKARKLFWHEFDCQPLDSGKIQVAKKALDTASDKEPRWVKSGALNCIAEMTGWGSWDTVASGPSP